MCIKRDYKVSVLNMLKNFFKSVVNRFVYSCDLFDVLVLIIVPYVGGTREETCLFCG